MSKRKVNIAVTGLNAIDSPGPGISVIRGLLEAKSFSARIIGLSYESLEPGIYMHELVDKTYQIPYPTAGTDTLLARIDQFMRWHASQAPAPQIGSRFLQLVALFVPPVLLPVARKVATALHIN